MATIKDIAREAGVSHGTVSNVLNGKGNVSVEKIKRVEAAVEKLDYQINNRAKSLRAGQSKSVSVILPNIQSQQYHILYSALAYAFNQHGYRTNLYTTNDQRERELAILEEIESNRDKALVTVSCLPDAKHYEEKLSIEMKDIIFVHRQPEGAKRFARFHMEQVGRDIAKRMMEMGYRKIGIFTNEWSDNQTNNLKDGIIDNCQVAGYEADFYPLVSSDEAAYRTAFSFFKEEVFDVIITDDIEKATYLQNAHYFGSQLPCPIIYSLVDAGFVASESIKHYHLNYQLLGKQIVQMIVDEGSRSDQVILENISFPYRLDKQLRIEREESLHILALPSPSTEALQKLLPHFMKQTGIDVRLAIFSFEEIYAILSDFHHHQHYDILRIDLAGLPWFAEQTLQPLYPELEHLLSTYPQSLVDRYAYVQDIAYAMPFDPSMQILFYRKDLFEDPKWKRMYYEMYKETLDLPETFTDYNQISAFFSQKLQADSPVPYGSCISIGNTEIIASEFLLRYYAKGGRLIQGEDVLGICPQIGQEALASYMEHSHIAQRLDAKWWNRSIEEFARGDLAMIIVYMNLFSVVSQSEMAPLIGYSHVPGKNPLLGGGSLGISKYSKKKTAVMAFYEWVYSNEIMEQITLLGGSSVNDFVYHNQYIMQEYPWLQFAADEKYEGIRESSFDSGVRFDLRKVEQIIGLAIKNTMNDMMTIEETIAYMNLRLAEMPLK